MDNELLRVTNVSISELFGIYDHKFTLNSEDRITILHGPNGVGKTILLKCISALFNGHYSFLRKTPFKTFVVALSDQSQITIHRKVIKGQVARRKGKGDLSRVELVAEVRASDHSKLSFPITQLSDVEHLAKFVEQNSPYIYQAGENTWLDRRTDRLYSSEELVEANPSLIGNNRAARLKEAEPEPLTAIRKRVKVSLIQTERLAGGKVEDWDFPHARMPTSSVNNYARQLQRQIEATLAQYGRSAQQLDQSFPQRLIQEHIVELELSELKRRMEKLEARQHELSEIGLLEKVPARPFDPDSLDDADRAKIGPMTLYLLDSEKKISSFDGVAGRLKLLTDSARNKFKNKTLSINKERGLQVTGAGEEVLELDALSSGEQHEIVLMYELLFKTPPNSLVMIDEPELSLHVAWQRLFLPELLSVSKTVGFDVILATHSPFIVGGRLDLMIGLEMEGEDMQEVTGIRGIMG